MNAKDGLEEKRGNLHSFGMNIYIFSYVSGYNEMTSHPFTVMDIELGDCCRIQSVFKNQLSKPLPAFVRLASGLPQNITKRGQRKLREENKYLLVWFSKSASQDSGFFAVALGTCWSFGE